MILCGRAAAWDAVSKQQAIDNIRKDVADAENIVRKAITRVKLTQAKFDALVCHAFNNGNSQLLSIVNQGCADQVIVSYLLKYHWTHDAQTHLIENSNGLLKRSEWEATAFGYKGPFYKNLIPPMPTWGSY